MQLGVLGNVFRKFRLQNNYDVEICGVGGGEVGCTSKNDLAGWYTLVAAYLKGNTKNWFFASGLGLNGYGDFEGNKENFSTSLVFFFTLNRASRIQCILIA